MRVAVNSHCSGGRQYGQLRDQRRGRGRRRARVELAAGVGPRRQADRLALGVAVRFGRRVARIERRRIERVRGVQVRLAEERLAQRSRSDRTLRGPRYARTAWHPRRERCRRRPARSAAPGRKPSSTETPSRLPPGAASCGDVPRPSYRSTPPAEQAGALSPGGVWGFRDRSGTGARVAAGGPGSRPACGLTGTHRSASVSLPASPHVRAQRSARGPPPPRNVPAPLRRVPWLSEASRWSPALA